MAAATAYIPSRGTEITCEIVRNYDARLIIETLNKKITSIINGALFDDSLMNKESLMTSLVLLEELDELKIKVVDFCFLDNCGVLLAFYFHNELYTLDVFGDTEIVLTTDSKDAEIKTFGQVRNLINSDVELHRETNTHAPTFQPKAYYYSI